MAVTAAPMGSCVTVQRLWSPRTISLRSWGWHRIRRNVEPEFAIERSEPAVGKVRPIDPVLACLTPGEAVDLDAIAERSGLEPSRLLPRLFELELQGLVQRVGGGRFVRIDRTC